MSGEIHLMQAESFLPVLVAATGGRAGVRFLEFIAAQINPYLLMCEANELRQTGRAINLADPTEQKRLSPSAITLFIKMANIWSLTDAQALSLIGAASPATLHEWEVENEGRTLAQDTLMRISYLVGIFKALNICHGQDLADSWILLPNQNPIFAGLTPLEFMVQNGQPGMATVRRLLDARCQGQ